MRAAARTAIRARSQSRHAIQAIPCKGVYPRAPMRKILLPLLLSTLTFAPAAEAFCCFYVAPGDAPLYADATMVALMRDGTRTALSMSNNYKGPAADFAMVVPVPIVLQKENVKTLKHDIFKKLEQLT